MSWKDRDLSSFARRVKKHGYVEKNIDLQDSFVTTEDYLCKRCDQVTRYVRGYCPDKCYWCGKLFGKKP